MSRNWTCVGLDQANLEREDTATGCAVGRTVPAGGAMSGVGVLSFEYKQAQDLAQRIALVLAAAAHDRVDRQAQLELARLLRGLAPLLDPLNAHAGDAGAALLVPVGLVQRLRDERRELADELPVLMGHLQEGQPLAPEDVAILELIKDLTERESSVVFRRMVRR
jgi:hypothetical protein